MHKLLNKNSFLFINLFFYKLYFRNRYKIYNSNSINYYLNNR